jgi:hydroxymethylbilane synthase
MKAGACQVLLLAYAGVYRMGYQDMIIKHLDTEVFCPPAGQGIIGIEVHAETSPNIKQKVREIINNTETEADISIERAFLRTINGGCSIPVFAHISRTNQSKIFTAGIVSLDGKNCIRISENVNKTSTEQLGIEVAEKLLLSGGKEILNQVKLQLQF